MASASSPTKKGVLLIQFAKAPVAGRVKTRMIPHLTAEQASELHSELFNWTARVLCTDKLGSVELWLAGDVDREFMAFTDTLGFDAHKTQWGRDLGERMANAIADGLERFEKVILVGSDCPAIDRNYLREAVLALDDSDVVLGPAQDGGYVLVAARVLCREMFMGIEWGSSSVFDDTLEILSKGAISWQSLAVLPDIDRPEDLPLWFQLRDDQP
ncbi:MAG: TIGR04282 family arsenosugar biosynthesis glycosyltransferase [Halioglobus sp.]